MTDPRLFQLMVEQVKDYAFFLLDPDGHIRTWNLGAERIKGYTPKEIIGRHFSTFYMREAVESGWPQHELEVAAAEGRFEDEGWRVRKDGSRFWANVVITALRESDGRLLGFSKITRDLTERRAHEEALRQSEEHFRLLVEGVVDYAIFMLDPDGVVASWNGGAQRIHGYAREEIVGRHFSRFYTQDEIAAGRPWHELAAASREGRAEDEGWRVRKTGERFWARVVVTPVHDAEGSLRGFAKVTQDLTQRRHIQDLEKAAKNVNEFIAMLAHELRNPLAPILNAAQLMGQLAPGTPEHDKLRGMIERQSAQLARIVDDMVDITRITRGVLSIQYEAVDLRDVVRRALESAGPAIEAARHRVDLDLPEAPLTVHGDPYRLTQVLANLFGNAARYTPPGGHIAVRAAAEGDTACLVVRDNGRGIEADMLERIFGMFVQGRSPLERVGGGLGIGLAVARRLADMHGGSLTAKSEGENRGSEFTLRLPLYKSQAPVVRPPELTRPPQPVRPRRVLVVDDNPDAASTLELLLRRLGQETRVAHGGEEALVIAREFRPDLVLLDLGMPDMDGYEVARRLRTLQEVQVRVVAVTGWGSEADRERSRAAGFDQHLVKPVDPQELSRLLGERNGATLH